MNDGKYVGTILSATDENGVQWVTMLTADGVVCFGPTIDPECYGFLLAFVGLSLNLCVQSKQAEPGPGGSVVSYGMA